MPVPATLLVFPASATAGFQAFLKAYVHGHYRLNRKTGQRIWVDSYTDKRPERGRTEFAHWFHRVGHFQEHMAHGRLSHAMHAFHDLNHEDSHKLAVQLGVAHPDHKGDSKADLLSAVHGRIKAKGEEYQAKVAAQVKADWERRKAAGTAGKKPAKRKPKAAVTPERYTPSADTLNAGDPYEHIETRPGTTDKQCATGARGLAALARRIARLSPSGGGDGTVLGARMYEGFRATGENALVGQTIKTPGDLAALAQVYRDPRFETYRAIFVDDNGRVVGESAYTSRMPAAVAVNVSSQSLQRIEKDKLQFGASGFYLMHNHPSGSPAPSNADVLHTKELAKRLPGFLFHVIIDHDAFSVIEGSGFNGTVLDKDLASINFHATPSVPHPMLGATIDSPSSAAKVAKQLQVAATKAPVLVMTKGPKAEVDTILSMPLDAMTDEKKRPRFLASLREAGRQTGAGGNRFLVLSKNEFYASAPKIANLIKQNIITDAINAHTGESMRASGIPGPSSGAVDLFSPRRDARKSPGPREGERNAAGLVFHDGRWHREDSDQTTKAPPAKPLDDYAERALARWVLDGKPTKGLHQRTADQWAALTPEQRGRVERQADRMAQQDRDDAERFKQNKAREAALFSSAAAKLKAGEALTDAEIEGLGLRVRGSEFSYLSPVVQRLFGISKMKVREAMGDALKESRTDMGAKLWIANPRKALANAAAWVQAREAGAGGPNDRTPKPRQLTAIDYSDREPMLGAGRYAILNGHVTGGTDPLRYGSQLEHSLVVDRPQPGVRMVNGRIDKDGNRFVLTVNPELPNPAQYVVSATPTPESIERQNGFDAAIVEAPKSGKLPKRHTERSSEWVAGYQRGLEVAKDADPQDLSDYRERLSGWMRDAGPGADSGPKDGDTETSKLKSGDSVNHEASTVGGTAGSTMQSSGNRRTDKMPISESERNRKQREQAGLTAIVKVDARKLAEIVEHDEGDALEHKPARSENIEALLAAGTPLDAYPQVGVYSNGKLSINDGRHRIAVAAKHGMQIEIATTEGNAKRIQERLSSAGKAAENSGPKDGDTKTENGKTYVLRDGRWHLQAEPVEPDPEKVAASNTLTKNPTPKTPEPQGSLVAQHSDLMTRLRNGEASLAEYKDSFKSFVENREALRAELSKLKKDELLKKYTGWHARPSDTKDDLVRSAMNNMAMGFALGRTVSYSFSSDRQGAQDQAIGKIVDEATQADIDTYAGEIAKTREAHNQKMDQMRQASSNPKTLDDFRTYMRVQDLNGLSAHQAYFSLTPEQRAAFDQLSAVESRAARAHTDPPAEVRTAGAPMSGQVIETKHTKTGQPLFVVQAAERVDREIYNQWNATAKRLGGWYSSFRGAGAVPGFQFKTREAADAFHAYLGGDTSGAQSAAQARRDAFADDRSQSAVERLHEMADRLDSRADDSLGRERQVNTDRRARMAATAEASANADKALAGTMRNIANAIQDGTVKFLDRVRQKAQVEMLASAVRDAQWEERKAKEGRYTEDTPPATQETADYAKWPKYNAYRSDLARLGRQLEGQPGLQRAGKALLKLADDTSADYLKFAKENLEKVSGFRTQDGKIPEFSSLAAAEASALHSGFKGRAIPLSMGGRKYTLILSPSEARTRGIWTGDNDRSITLPDELGEEIASKTVNQRGLDVPWGFHVARERRARLKAMGIETPQEYRSALREFIGLQQRQREPDRIKAMERSMIGRRNDGLDFFPTPAGVASRMIEAADIKPGMAVLEPSAGMGHIAEQIRAAGADPDVAELSHDRRALLEAKGFNVVGNDFLQLPVTGKTYDRIIMNPPFSDRRDVEHVQHAYNLLKPGGRLVAIMGEGSFFGSDKRATSFRDWLDSVGGGSEKLGPGTFTDPALPVTTGANARMVVIHKPGGEPMEKARSSAPARLLPILRRPMFLLYFPALAKAYIHGHYRTNKKTGAQIWVDSYTDKRTTRAGPTQFAHWRHRKEHVRSNLAHGHITEALHAFHDLNHEDAHRLATDLQLHDGTTRHRDKKALMEAVHGKLMKLHDALKAKVKTQEEARAKARPEPKPKSKPAAEQPASPKHDDQVLDIAGEEVPFIWRLVEADTLAPTENIAENQLRDRTRAASTEQVASMAGNLKFRLLAESPLMDYGAPVLAKDGKTIIGGNGRTLAIRRAYAHGQADHYRAELAQRAERFGLDPAAVNKFKAPVLVRVLARDVDVKQAAIASNEGGGARMSGLEQARVDGERLGDLEDLAVTDDGDLTTAANRPFIRRFLATVPVSQRPAFLAADGDLSQEGITRLRNAVLYRAYGASDTLSRMVESTDAGQRNVLAALVKLAPTVAQVRDDVNAGRLHQLDISADIVAATAALAKVRADKTFGSVDEYLRQTGLFGDTLSPESALILRHFDANLRSAKAIGTFLLDYYSAVRAAGDPHQGGLFDDAPPDKPNLLRQTHERYQKDHRPPQQDDLFKSWRAGGRPGGRTGPAGRARPARNAGPAGRG
jgi:hypothetical protein